ncbi:hypothetical protein BJY04DRAFT_218505 [Aspergillus karnatakaensis]|uniref:uncharacterized protein n=1 Tax=Aspergillus karnatakaensis TaxID=1810916 RepID=UPI003CCE4F51
MSWIILTIFSLIRMTAGALVIAWQQTSSTAVMIASIILLNTGVFPLIAATLGFIRIITSLEHNMGLYIRQCLRLSRILFLIGIGLTVAGGVLEGSDTISDVLIGLKLVKAGYIVVVVFAGCLLATQGYLWTQWYCLLESSRTILKVLALAAPFIIVRIVYLFLSVYEASDERWNDLTGPVIPFLFMGLGTEYIVVWMYLATGFVIPRKEGAVMLDEGDREEEV